MVVEDLDDGPGTATESWEIEMGEADEGDAGWEHLDEQEPAPLTELGGRVQEDALPDQGRLVIQRMGISLQGPTPAIVVGIGVTGTALCAVVAEQPHGLLPGLAAMVAILAHHLIYCRTVRTITTRSTTSGTEG